MKRTLYLLILVSLFSIKSYSTEKKIMAVPIIGPAVTDNDTVAISNSFEEQTYLQAMRYLNGINTDVDYSKALVRFAYLAKLGDPRSINSLAGMISQGLGIPQNEAKARELYEQASLLGYGKASYNLAMMYKTGKGGDQDFLKAAEYAQTALQQGYNQALYMLGYLNYKGFGVNQNYNLAVEYFTKGAELKQASSTYFLGLCYLGGYGVEKNISMGKKLVEKAAILGNDHAVDFILERRDEKYEQPLKNDKEGNPYPHYRRISKNDSFRLENFEGNWTGKILRYDFSGKQVIEERFLKLNFSIDKDGQLSGQWEQNDSIIISVKGEKKEGFFQLEDMQYLQSWNRIWKMQTLAFQADTIGKDTVLYAELIQFCPQIMEPSAPLMLELKRAKNMEENQKDKKQEPPVIKKIKVFPNPFDNSINLQISLIKETDATITICDISGKTLLRETHKFVVGEQTRIINTTDLPSGSYSFSVKGDGINQNTVLIKK